MPSDINRNHLVGKTYINLDSISVSKAQSRKSPSAKCLIYGDSKALLYFDTSDKSQEL